jgi:hypothetical protein
MKRRMASSVAGAAVPSRLASKVFTSRRASLVALSSIRCVFWVANACEGGRVSSKQFICSSFFGTALMLAEAITHPKTLHTRGTYLNGVPGRNSVEAWRKDALRPVPVPFLCEAKRQLFGEDRDLLGARKTCLDPPLLRR